MRKVLSVGPVIAVVVTAALSPTSGAAAPAAPTCRGLTATIVGTSGDDALTGTRGADVIAARGGDDRLVGLGGDDVLCGGEGADRLRGGDGHDRLYGGRDALEERRRWTVLRGDHLEGGPGPDLLSAGTGRPDGQVRVREPNQISFRASGHAVTVDLAQGVALGEGVDAIIPGRDLAVLGSQHDDVLQGSDRPEELDGGRGDDTIRGGAGGDAVIDYHGDDRLDGEDGSDLVISTTGVDEVSGGSEADFIIAGSSRPATVLGGAGNDYLWRWITTGETGPLDGGPGRDQLEVLPQLWFDREVEGVLDAEAGTAVLTTGSKVHTTPFSGIRSFTLWGLPWTFEGTDGADFVQLLEGRLDAHGHDGDDFFIGGDRDDILDGGAGIDAVWGGGGDNTCIDTEEGDCDSYPWDTVVSGRLARPSLSSGHRGDVSLAVVSRWRNHQELLTAH